MNNFDFNNTREEKKKRTFPDFNNVREDSGKVSHEQLNQDKSQKNASGNSTNSTVHERIDINRLNKEFNKSKHTVRNGQNHQQKKKRRNNTPYYIALGVFLFVVIVSAIIITNFISNQHKNHLSRIINSLNTGEMKNAVDYFNDRIVKDGKCRQEALSLYLSCATKKFSDYIDQNATYEQTEEAFKILGEIADDNTSLEIQKLWEGIVQIKSAADIAEESLAVETEQVEIGTSSDTEENNQIIGTIFLEDCTILESASYQGNEGDSFVYPIGQHQFTQGQCDIYGKTYYHGIEAWIARWNYEDEISWVYSIFALPIGYKTLTGSVVLIDSYNTENFDATLYFIDADIDKEIESYHLTPEKIPFNINVPVDGIKKLKIYVKDNKAVSGGTSLGLVNAFLNSDDIDDEETEQENPVVQNIPSDAFEWNNHYYYVYSGANSWEEASNFCNGIGGYLAVIDSKEENDALHQYLKNNNIQNAYFGLTDREVEGEWKWVDGTTVKYTNWATPTEPNAENSKEDYAMFYYKYPDGTWNDGDFGGSTVKGDKNYICEWSIP